MEAASLDDAFSMSHASLHKYENKAIPEDDEDTFVFIGDAF